MPDVVVPRDAAAAVDPVLERAIQRLRAGRST
jgi:hypothetical protein